MMRLSDLNDPVECEARVNDAVADFRSAPTPAYFAGENVDIVGGAFWTDSNDEIVWLELVTETGEHLVGAVPEDVTLTVEAVA